jgi:hypothetical protein
MMFLLAVDAQNAHHIILVHPQLRLIEQIVLHDNRLNRLGKSLG